MTNDMTAAAIRFLTPELLSSQSTEELYTLHANYKAVSFASIEGLRKIEAEIGRRYLRENGHDI